MEFRRRARRRTVENIVPLVNIVFLLLIFFMLAGTLRGPEALGVEPPESAQGVQVGQATLTLSLDRNGALEVEGRVIEAGALGRVLAEGAAGDSPRRIRVRADRRARAEQLLPLLETLERLGFEDVALVTRDAR